MRTMLAPIALFLLAAPPLAEAQYYGQQQYGQPQYGQQQQYGQPQYGQPQYQQQLPQQGGDQTILYGVRKNQPPAGMVIEQGNAPAGIPTSGIEQQRQLSPNSARRGPTTIYRDNRGLSVFTGPDGTTVCRDVRGRTVVCN